MASSGAMLLNQTGGWHPEPNFRGTYSILSSCWITLILCLWSAVHLNIPAYGKHGRQRWKKLLFVLLGLIAPELIAWLAYCQWIKAREINSVMTRILGQTAPKTKRSWAWWKKKNVNVEADMELGENADMENNQVLGGTQPNEPRGEVFEEAEVTLREHQPSNETQEDVVRAETQFAEDIRPALVDEDDVSSQKSPKRVPIKLHKWTMKHSFYVLMGGFALENGDSEPNIMPEGVDRISLNTDGFLWMAENHIEMVPNISRAQISDKSSSNTLAKTLACVQAAWFCINCIVRVSQHLQVSLLELNTAAHAICALIVYFLWWEKPQDVGEPSTIDGSLREELIAMNSSLNGIRITQPQSNQKRGIEFVIEYTSVLDLGLFSSDFESSYNAALQMSDQPPLKRGYTRLFSGQYLHNHYISIIHNLHIGRRGFDSFPGLSRAFVDLSPTQVRMLELAHCGLKKPQWSPYMESGFQLHSVDDWDLAKAENEKQIYIACFIAGLLYSSIHFSAWNDKTLGHSVGPLLWRISCITIATSPVALPVLIYLWDWGGKLREKATPWKKGFLGLVQLVLALCASPGLIFFLLCRLNLVAEAYFSLKHLPVTAYMQPNWSNYIPHFS